MSKLYDLLKEDTPLSPTQHTSKQGWLFLASVLIGCTICVPVFFMGAQMSQQLEYASFVPAVLCGGILACFLAIITGLAGQDSGLPTAMLTKVAFGSKGYVIANLAMAVTAIGWFGIQTNIFSDAFVKLSSQVWGLELNKTVVVICSGLLMSSTAVIGFRGLGKLSYIAVPLLIILLLLPLYYLYKDGSLDSVSSFTPSSIELSFGQVVAIVAGAYSFACTMPDITRFMRNRSDTIKGMVANFAFAYPLLLILTGTTAIAAQNGDFMQVMLNFGFGSLAIMVLFISTWTTNDTNAYAGALSANLFLPKFQRWQLAAMVGVFGTLCAVFGIFEHFMNWLIFTGNLFAPMAGAYVADYYFNKKNYSELENIPSVRWHALTSWMIGLIIALCTTSKSNMGFELFSLTTVPMLDGLFVSAFCYLLLQKLPRKRDSF